MCSTLNGNTLTTSYRSSDAVSGRDPKASAVELRVCPQPKPT